MNKTLRTATLILIAGLMVLSLSSLAKSQPPPLPMTIEGYVTIQEISGTNITAPAGLNVYAKQGTTVYSNVSGTTPTNAQGYYIIAVTGPVDLTPIDLWVQDIKVTTITFNQSQFLPDENLSVVDTTPPTIQVLSPLPQAVVSTSQPVWVNATLTDDLAIDPTTISMTLNQTPLVWTFNSTTGLLSSQNTLTPGLYVANITVSDIAGNTASEIWNFTASLAVPPTISITSPTTTSPVYVQSGKVVQVGFSYTEPSPLNWTITISNATGTLVSVSNTTAITPGTSATVGSVTIPQTAAAGTYDVSVTMYNTQNLYNTTTQTGAVVVDNTPPTIGIPYQNPPGQSVDPSVTLNVSQGSSVSVSVNITDPSGVEQAILSYNNGSGWVNLTMSLSTGNQYAATIPGQPAGTAVTYYVTATDGALNTARTPADTLYYPYNVISEFPNFAVLLLILAAGATLAVVTSKTTKRKSPQLK